ncbi:hypothetical protein [Burkholderia sp. AU16741]|uniref:hypothetical protein n=1 Tax=Burkholderia sp. AU16741 TaxID=2015347 RepID=UPI0015C5BBC9|nr:hypothetical protein [Burkholderia sp. AU16741]
MKSSTAVGGLPHEATAAPARGVRGGQETGNALPTTLALRRKRYPDRSHYPFGAQEMRGSCHCL